MTLTKRIAQTSANVQTIESNSTGAPQLIGTIDFSKFTTANGNTFTKFSKVLTRHARQRTFIFVNNLNQPITGVLSEAFDSTLPNTSILPYVSDVSSQTLANGGQMALTSEKYPDLAVHTDSISLGIGIGATLPTSGNVQIYVVEVF